MNEIEFETLERVSGSFVSDDFRERQNDVIWRVRMKDSWLYVYLLLEFQSSIDRYMALRVMVYVGLLYQELIRGKQLTDDGHLPPVLPIVLYNGSSRWTAPLDVSELVATGPEGLARYCPELHYLLLEEREYDEVELASQHNLVAALFRLENSLTPADVCDVLDALRDWLQDPAQAELNRSFSDWLHDVLLPKRMPGVEIPKLDTLGEVKTMLAERVEEWTKLWREEGMEKGMEKGELIGRICTLQSVLKRDISDREVLTKLSIGELERMAAELATLLVDEVK